MSVSGQRVESEVSAIASQRARVEKSRTFESVRDFAHQHGLQRVAPQQIVVGGTNGKSTTVSYLQQILSRIGLRVGSTTSPHLHDFCERIRLDGVNVAPQECLTAVLGIASLSDTLPLTYFDLTTLAALCLFKRWRVDVAIVEVGLGGRLDCANVVDADVAVITNVDLDHKEILGESIQAISVEKVPIARAGKPLVYGSTRENRVIAQFALERQCPVFQLGREFGRVRDGTIFMTTNNKQQSVSGRFKPNINHEAFLAAVQTAALLPHVNDQVWSSLGCLAKPPGRFEHIRALERGWILDIAHNPAGVSFLLAGLGNENINECVAVFGCLRDKDVRGICEATSSLVPDQARIRDWVFTDSYGNRGLSAHSLMKILPRSPDRSYVEPALSGALNRAVDLAKNDVPIVVFGSVDVVSRARNFLMARTMVNAT